jgi:LysM repeat protein
MSQYTVKQGDNLWGIAEKLLGDGSRYSEIQRENNLRSDVIHPGQVLMIPGRGHSTTKYGATKYGTTSHGTALISVCSKV